MGSAREGGFARRKVIMTRPLFYNYAARDRLLGLKRGVVPYKSHRNAHVVLKCVRIYISLRL